MKTFLRKISSRKLWIALIGLAVGIAASFGIKENDYAQIAGIVTAAISVISYIFGEAKIDAAGASTNGVTEQLDRLCALIGMSADVPEEQDGGENADA